MPSAWEAYPIHLFIRFFVPLQHLKTYLIPVSYTHLDVYKRQGKERAATEVWSDDFAGGSTFYL